MLVTFSWRNIIKKTNIVIRILALTIIIFYILPKLLTLFWDVYKPGPKIKDQQLLEKPLRVINVSVNVS